MSNREKAFSIILVILSSLFFYFFFLSVEKTTKKSEMEKVYAFDLCFGDNCRVIKKNVFSSMEIAISALKGAAEKMNKLHNDNYKFVTPTHYQSDDGSTIKIISMEVVNKIEQ